MKKTRIIGLGFVGLIVVGAIAGGIFMKKTSAELDKLTNLPISEVDLSRVSDGSYKGGYETSAVAVQVEVTVRNHRIEDIDILKHNNGKGKPAEVLPQKVIAAQSLAVDVITGATYSSKAILKSIENALKGSPE